MSIPRTILLAWVAVGFLCSLAHGEKRKEGLTKADRQLFAWFDQLDLEDLTPARLVRLRTGEVQTVITDGKHERHLDEPRGYLLWEKDGKFRAVLADLTVATFEKKGVKPEGDAYVGWRPVSMEEEVKDMLTLFAQKSIDDFWEDGECSYYDRMGFHGQALALARYCAGNGREDLAARLLRATEQRLRKEGGTLRDRVETEIGLALTWRATLAWADTGQNCHALAALMRNIAKHCPHFYRVKWIAKTAADLEQMAIEDDAHVEVSDEELVHLSPDDQARELVYRLRDDNENIEEVWPRPWPFEPTKGNGAMKKLEALGLPAVPALLEALKDERPTCSVYRSNRYGGGAWPSTVAQLATNVLTEIAGVNFLWLIPRGGNYEEDRRAMRVVAEDWWKTTEEKGDIEWLRARVVSGGDGAQYCLEGIAKKHPEMLPELALNTVPYVTNPRARWEMLKLLKKVQTPEVNDLLMAELTAGPTRCNRVVAAYLLCERHQPEALGAMLAEFDAMPISALKTPSDWSVDFSASGFYEADSPGYLIGFLLSSDSILGVKAIGAVLHECDRHGRANILEACSTRLLFPPGGDLEGASKEVKAGIEEMVISELQDEEVLEGTQYDGTNNPRVAEIAAMVLSNCWPERYDFKIDAVPAIRAEQLAKIRATAAAAGR